jgi:hypothetical protein
LVDTACETIGRQYVSGVCSDERGDSFDNTAFEALGGLAR